MNRKDGKMIEKRDAHVAGSVRRGFERKEGGLSDGVNGETRNAR